MASRRYTAGKFAGLSLEARFWARVKQDAGDACWLWTGSRQSPVRYGRLLVEGQRVYAHRFSWILHYGMIPDGLYVLHQCDTPPCVRPDHLFLGTHSDNMQDMRSKGRQRITHQRGATHYKTRLTADDARALVHLHYAEGWSYPRLGRRYGMTHQGVLNICHGKTWRAATYALLVQFGVMLPDA